MIQRYLHRFLILFVMLLSLLSLQACDSQPDTLTLMKATQQFDSDKKRDQHIEYMRTHHMHALKHKRDETMYQGIRTEKHSLKACINCHVPETHNGKVLRHTDQEHFCTTCHTYVAQELNCFECHVDHPMKVLEDAKSMSEEADDSLFNESKATQNLNGFSKLNKQELLDLAFKYSDSKPTMEKIHKSVKESFKGSKQTDKTINSAGVDGVLNE